jgi:hypothetical protein
MNWQSWLLGLLVWAVAIFLLGVMGLNEWQRLGAIVVIWAASEIDRRWFDW